MSAPEPWYKCVDGPFPAYGGPVGVKDDGGGSTRARGLVGHMNLHRAAMNRDATLLQKYVDDDGEDVNEVEAAVLIKPSLKTIIRRPRSCRDDTDDDGGGGGMGSVANRWRRQARTPARFSRNAEGWPPGRSG